MPCERAGNIPPSFSIAGSDEIWDASGGWWGMWARRSGILGLAGLAGPAFSIGDSNLTGNARVRKLIGVSAQHFKCL
jgi:hypothetical protein